MRLTQRRRSGSSSAVGYSVAVVFFTGVWLAAGGCGAARGEAQVVATTVERAPEAGEGAPAAAAALKTPGVPMAEASVAGEALRRPVPAGKHRGVSWVAGGEVTAADFAPLVEAGVTHIVQTPFGWQRRHDSPEVRLVTEGRIYWGERDLGLETTTRLAHERGIDTLLKPHIWLTDPADGKWRGEIEMASEEDWQRWFASYRAFLLHYARLAERLGIGALAVGTELRTPAVRRPEDWRRLIAEVRQVYGGALTYSANWYREFEEVELWDDLDYIGIQAYFPLAEDDAPTLEELLAGWRRHLPAIEAVQRRYGKPVLFTEVGYRSMPAAARAPWEWPEESIRRGTAVADPETQARCYEAFFRTFWQREWFAGAYLWKWYPHHGQAGGLENPGFTPQNKPAQEVLGRWYRQ